MTLGQIVDFCLEYDEMHEDGSKANTRRRATQADIDAFFGAPKKGGE